MKRYPAYKDSGVDYLGEIPNHWGIIRTRFIFDVISGNGFPDELQGRQEGEFPFYKCSDINNAETYVDQANNYVNLSDVKTNRWSVIPRNSILLAKIGEALKKNHRKINSGECLVDNNMMAIVLKDGSAMRLKYYYYLMCLIRMEWFVNPGAVPSVDVSKFRSFRVLSFEKDEQGQIETFLDLKTAQIDALITKKERMVELLKEERTAIINQAVTKGLNPNAEMKDSGIEWLGKIPKYWEIKRLKYVANINPQRPDGISDETKVVFIAMESMNADGTYVNSIVRSYLEVKSGFTYFAEGDVIFAKITPCFENGKGALLRNLGTPIGFGSTEFHVLRAVKNKTIPEYLYFLTISGLFRGLGEAFMQGVAGQKRVTNDFVQDFIIGVPPVNEQAIVSSYLEDKIKKIDTQIGRGNKSIEYLKEYRTSLISEVVTGKIDVRGEVNA